MTETNTTQSKESTGKVRGLVVGLSSALGLMTAGTIFLASGALGVGPTTSPITTPVQVVAATATPSGTTAAKITTPGTGNATTPEQATASGTTGGTSETSTGTTTGKTSGGNSGTAPAPAAPAPAAPAPAAPAPAAPAAPTGADSTGYVRPEVYLANVTCEAMGDGTWKSTQYWAVRGGNHNGGRWQGADGNGVAYQIGAFQPGTPLVSQGSGGVAFAAVSMNGSGQIIDMIYSPSPGFIDAGTKCR